MTIKLIHPEVIVTLGAVALKALDLIAPHSMNLKEKVGKPFRWNDILVMPLYHPGPRARIHRSYQKQVADFISLSNFADPIRGLIST